MTNVNGIGYTQQAVPMTAQNAYVQQATPQYTTAPYQNDAFVSSNKQEKKSKHVVGKLLLTGALVVGGSIAARKFTGLKNYTKTAENANLKECAANLITTIADKSMEIGKIGVDYAKRALNTVKGFADKFLKEGNKVAEATKETKLSPTDLITYSRNPKDEKLKFFYETYMKNCK